MPPTPPAPRQINQVIASVGNFYVHFDDPEWQGDAHNDHAVICWAVLDDNITVVPLIHSPVNAKDVVQADTISGNYRIMNPYSHCSACVRPEIPPA